MSTSNLPDNPLFVNPGLGSPPLPGVHRSSLIPAVFDGTREGEAKAGACFSSRDFNDHLCSLSLRASEGQPIEGKQVGIPAINGEQSGRMDYVKCPGGSPEKSLQFGFLGNTRGITQPPPSESLEINKLGKWKLQRAAKHILNWKSLGKCHKTRLMGNVSIVRHLESGKVHYNGLVTCGSPWVCPVCAAKISERRREELKEALVIATSMGLKPYLLTLTVRHNNNDCLGDLLAKFSKARYLMRNRKPFKAWKKRIGLIGSIRSLEVTHGGNGWHVHTHEIFFCRSGFEYPFAVDVLPWWQDACISAGLPVPDCHGVDISLADGDVGGYVAKWGMENELTKSMVKRGREGNLSPWDFLRSFVSSGESLFSGLFREYASVFRGKKQLVWSIGLRDLLGLGVEETDKEVVERIEEGSELVGFLSLDQWRRVYRYEKRSEVLQIALNGINAVYAFIESLDGG